MNIKHKTSGTPDQFLAALQSKITELDEAVSSTSIETSTVVDAVTDADFEVAQQDVYDFLLTIPESELGKTFYQYGTHNIEELSYIISDEDLEELGYIPTDIVTASIVDDVAPVVDIQNKQVYTVDGRNYIYDKEHSEVVWIAKDDEEVDLLGDKASWRDMARVEVYPEDFEEGPQFWVEQVDYQLQDDSSYLVDDFILNELPYYTNTNLE